MPRLPSLLVSFALATLVPAALLVGTTRPAAAAEPLDPTRFEVTVLSTGLKQPMEMAVGPDRTVYYIELDGKLRALRPGRSEAELIGEVTVTTAQENGLIGLALDPEFARNSWIYLQYSPPDFPGQHISRFTLKDGKLDLASEKLLLKYEEQRKECCHHAGSLAFGPRGELFIAAGDNTHPHGDSQGYAPIDERADKAPWDAQKSSSNTNSYNGKVLRIRPLPDGTVEIPDGNLFPKDGSQGRPEIYVMGCRNPWRISVDSASGNLYWGDVGPDAGGDGDRGPRGYDEINQARGAGNFGWPYFIGNNFPYADVDFATGKIGPKFDPLAPINESPNNTGIKTLPPAQPALLYYPYGDSTEFPELGKGGRTACAGPVYHYSEGLASTTKFPPAYDKALFIYEWTRHWIKVVHLDDAFQVKSIEPFMPDQPFVRPIDMEFGPEGALYLIEYGETWGVNKDSRLIRIDYVRGNRAPLAVATAENNIGKQPLAVALSSKGSFDKDQDDALTYEWRVIPGTPAGTPAEPKVVSREPNPTVTFSDPGVFNVELVVSDRQGAQRAASIPVVVGNARPTVKFLHPQEGDFYDADQPIPYRLYVNDPEDGTSDFDEADAKQLPEIDPEAGIRLALNAAFVNGPIPTAASAGQPEQGPPGLLMMKRSDCFNCHAVDQKRVGPPLLDVASKYRGQTGAIDASIQRVLKGSTGVWGKIPMIPHSQHTPEQVREMVQWIYSLEPAGLVRVFQGFTGEVPVDKAETAKPGHYSLQANYTDRGFGEIPALNASATLHLRQRLVEAEAADEVHGAQILGGTASGGRFIGAINHENYLRFDKIDFDRVKRLSFQVTSAGSGGKIEVHLDRPDGPAIATADVEVNGSWDKWYERTVDLGMVSGRHDLYLVFMNPQRRGGLMNLDSVYFHP